MVSQISVIFCRCVAVNSVLGEEDLAPCSGALLQGAKISPLEAINSEISFCVSCASMQLPNAVLCFEGMGGKQRGGRGDFGASRSWALFCRRDPGLFLPCLPLLLF